MGCLNANSSLSSFVSNCFIGYINAIILVLVPLAMIIFFWGIIRYIYYADSQSERERGKYLIIWGLVALFVMFSVWGLVALINTSFFGMPTPIVPSYYQGSSSGSTGNTGGTGGSLGPLY